MGRLPETADALASRFISVHTALLEGKWTTASHLELYPLEPVQWATTATMLEPRVQPQCAMVGQGDKGKKGNPKHRGRGKGKEAPKRGLGGAKERQTHGGTTRKTLHRRSNGGADRNSDKKPRLSRMAWKEV